MANVIMMPQREDPLAKYMQDYLAKREQRRQSQRQEEDQIAAFQAKQFLALPTDQQQANLSRLDPRARKYILDQNGYTPHTLTDAEAFQAEVARKNRETFPGLAPEAHRAGTYQTAYNAAQPKEITDTDIARQNLPEDQFAKSVRVSSGVDMKPNEQAAADLASSKYANIEIPESGAKIKLTGAQTTKELTQAEQNRASADNSRASAGKTRAETAIVGKTAKPPAAAVKQIQQFNAQLTRLSNNEQDLIEKYQAAQASADVKAKREVPAIRARLEAVRAMMKPLIEKRNQLANAIGYSGEAEAPEESTDGAESVTRAEYDALLSKGFTPQQLAAEGIVVR